MNENASPSLPARAMDGVRRFFEDGGFAAFSLCLLLGFDALLAVLLLTPGGDEGMASLADELRVWCFGYDPATGHMEWGYVFSMLFPPLLLSGLLLFFWGQPVRRIFSRPSTLLLYLLPALLLVGGAGMAFAHLAGPPPSGELPFPAEAIRTHLPTPKLDLINQSGEAVNLADLRGKVVVLTGVYTCCYQTCPLIIAQARAAIGKLDPALIEDLRFIAVTLDPERDSPEVLLRYAETLGLAPPLYQFATGEIADVEATLDALGIARERSEETDVISHTSQFVLVDRAGKVAYRLGLGERQTRWLESAMNALLRESQKED